MSHRFDHSQGPTFARHPYAAAVPNAQSMARTTSSRTAADNSQEGYIHRKYQTVRNELDKTLGLRFWAKYSGIMFWSNVFTPLNLAIIVLSTLAAAQSSTSFLPSPALKGITIAVAVLSTINTFFKPHDRVQRFQAALQKWCEFGARFEAITWSADNDDTRYKELLDLHAEVNKYDVPQERDPFVEGLARLHVAIFMENDYRWNSINEPKKICSRCCCWSSTSSGPAVPDSRSEPSRALRGRYMLQPESQRVITIPELTDKASTYEPAIQRGTTAAPDSTALPPKSAAAQQTGTGPQQQASTAATPPTRSSTLNWTDSAALVPAGANAAPASAAFPTPAGPAPTSPVDPATPAKTVAAGAPPAATGASPVAAAATLTLTGSVVPPATAPTAPTIAAASAPALKDTDAAALDSTGPSSVAIAVAAQEPAGASAPSTGASAQQKSVPASKDTGKSHEISAD